jgi:type I restriction enzyme, R subunit
MQESIDQDTLAIFDLLKEGKTLEEKDLKAIKKSAVETLATLKR